MKSYEKPDFWALKAQKEDYPARSVYKLKEIDEKFTFFASAQAQASARGAANKAGGMVNDAARDTGGKTPVLRVLDLGAAPGSWSLYVLRRYGKAAPGALFLAAVDLLPLSRHFDQLEGDHFFFIQGDFTSGPVREALRGRGPYNAVICDAAPPTTGSRTVDTLRSLALVEEALSFAESCLAPGGNIAVKVFQGGGTAALLKQLREQFATIKSFKPAACRANSFETYYIGLGKKSSITA